MNTPQVTQKIPFYTHLTFMSTFDDANSQPESSVKLLAAPFRASSQWPLCIHHACCHPTICFWVCLPLHRLTSEYKHGLFSTHAHMQTCNYYNFQRTNARLCAADTSAWVCVCLNVCVRLLQAGWRLSPPWGPLSPCSMWEPWRVARIQAPRLYWQEDMKSKD